MDLEKALRQFHSQKHAAIRRGIGWELTFKQWLEWWGEDYRRRGRGQNQLQMQRRLDSGPYAPGNIVKGTPRQNQRTRSAVLQNRRALENKLAHEAEIDARPATSDDYEPEDESISAYFSRGQYDAVIRRSKTDVLSGKGG